MANPEFTPVKGYKQSMLKTIALYDICGKIPNLALMKLSTYYKAKGYTPVLCKERPLLGATLHYASCVFHHPRANRALAGLQRYLGGDLVAGGSGVNLKQKLPPEIDCCFPDYSLYGWRRYALGFLSRGCNSRCNFCLVPEKEGQLREDYATFDDFVPAGQRNVMLLDANLLPTTLSQASLFREKQDLLRRLGGCPRMPFSPNSSLFEKFYPRNINYMPAVKFSKCLNLRKNCCSRTAS